MQQRLRPEIVGSFIEHGEFLGCVGTETPQMFIKVLLSSELGVCRPVNRTSNHENASDSIAEEQLMSEQESSPCHRPLFPYAYL